MHQPLNRVRVLSRTLSAVRDCKMQNHRSKHSLVHLICVPARWLSEREDEFLDIAPACPCSRFTCDRICKKFLEWESVAKHNDNAAFPDCIITFRFENRGAKNEREGSKGMHDFHLTNLRRRRRRRRSNGNCTLFTKMAMYTDRGEAMNWNQMK